VWFEAVDHWRIPDEVGVHRRPPEAHVAIALLSVAEEPAAADEPSQLTDTP
jgi:hypothetical protein